jgi:adenylate cyclase
MSAPLGILVFQNNQVQFAADTRGPVEIGRSKGHEPLGLTADGGRLVIAAPGEMTVARTQARIEPAADGCFRLTNLSRSVPIGLPDGTQLEPGGARELPLGARLTVGSKGEKKVVRVQSADAALTSLAEATAPPGRSVVGLTRFPALDGAHDPGEFLRWLQTTLDVLRGAAGSDHFFARAAQAAKEIVGLDSASFLLLDDVGNWRPHPPCCGGNEPSQAVLSHVRAQRRPVFGSARDIADTPNLANVQAVVAAPILSRRGDVVGALYGERRATDSQPAHGAILELEAKLVELLAGAVAAGLARLEEEQQAAAARVRYEEFLTPELARHLLAQPSLLEGREVEITVLFADIRGYSGVCERLGAEESVRWVSEVLGELSDCVRAEGGVLVDYIGDELMAMWGAPIVQPDHAARACRAAAAMLGRLAALDARWRAKTDKPLEIGVGIHTGPAHVGNVGTRHKFKYGPLGPTNNLASRVQGATKYVGVPMLITGATRARLGDGFATRRLTRVKVVNINEPVDLVQLTTEPPPRWAELRDGYEAALADFEIAALPRVIRGLGAVLTTHPDDGPSLLLLTRAVQALQPNAPKTFDPVWVLPGK